MDIKQMTDDELEAKVRGILQFHRGRANKVSRWQLVEQIFGRDAAANRGNNNPFDRQIRNAIAKWRDVDLIVSTSGTDGYWIAEDMNDINTIADEYVKRSREMEEKARNLVKRGLQTFGGQMPLM